MAVHLTKFKGKLTAIGNRVIVSDMYFGEQKTKSGLIISNDDGNVRGIYPRWAKVYSKGPDNKDPYEVGDWILIEHGRWTRSALFEDNGDELELRMVESESVLMYSKDKPDTGLQLGRDSVGDFASDKVDAGDFEGQLAQNYKDYAEGKI